MPGPAAINVGTFPKVTDARLNGAIGDLSKNLVVAMNKVSENDSNAFFDSKDAEYRIWDKTLMHGLPAGGYVPYGADPNVASPSMGHQVERMIQQYGRATEVTLAALEDAAQGKIGLRANISEWLAQSWARTILALQQTWYFESLNGVTQTAVNGRNVVDRRSVDGQPYFSASHGFLGVNNVTNSNLSPAARALTKTNIVAILQQASGWKDELGSPMQNEATGIVVGDHLIGLANVLTKSTQDPDNANNALNILKHENYGKAIGGVQHYRYMGVDDFCVKFSLPAGLALDGTAIYYKRGKKYVARNYPKTHSEQSMVFEYRTECLVCGDNPYQWITNRAAA